MDQNIKENGKMIREMVMEYIIGIVDNLKEINMMDNGKMIRKMVMEYSHMLMEINKNNFGHKVLNCDLLNLVQIFIFII